MSTRSKKAKSKPPEPSNDGERLILAPPLWADLARESDELLARARTHYPHKEGRGASREALFRDFLEKRLPRTVAAGKGHLQDSHGTITSEFDIVLYDPLARFIISSGHEDRCIYPVEAVIAAIEVRTKIDRSAIRDTQSKSEELRKLLRYYTPSVVGEHFYQEDDLTDLSKGLPANQSSPFSPGFPGIMVGLVGLTLLRQVPSKSTLTEQSSIST
jgi:hypothetical protein